MFSFFFFFQAEDGIRDYKVTGVQTCALPISMKFVSKTLGELGVPHETRVVSAHRTPDLLFKYASNAEKRGIEVIIAGAGGADRKSTRLNSSHLVISYAVFCLKKKTTELHHSTYTLHE